MVVSMSEINPLLHEQFRIPFDLIRPEHVEPGIRELLGRANESLTGITSAAGPRTWENTMAPLDHLSDPLEYAFGVVRHLESVATTPELRAAYNAVQPEVSAFYSSLPLNAELWNAVKSYAATEEAKALTGTRRRFLTKTVDNFRRHGAELDAAGKKRLEEIDVELTQITTKFGENVLDSTNAFELIISDGGELAGLARKRRRGGPRQRRSEGAGRAGASRCRRPATWRC